MSTNFRPSIECPDPVLPIGAQGLLRVAVDDALSQLVLTFAGVITLAQESYLLNPRSYTLTGGQRLFPRILSAQIHNPPGTPLDLLNRRILLQLNQTGDFSTYTLTVTGEDIDPFFASHKLRFRLGCDDPFDCRPPAVPAPTEAELQVVIDYLAKDYSSFRQALLDFVPTRLPEWTERSEADIGIMLLELFAATADTLSYMQDRVANEAFLQSATQRRSVAGHLALIGYEMDEGASAHTWLQFRVNQTLTSEPGIRVSNRPLRDNEPVIVFETHGRVTLRPEHNEMPVFNWGNQRCCLPKTALSATLLGEFGRLQVGDYILFDDKQGHRDIVRLIAKPAISETEGSPPQNLTLIRWSNETPLTNEFCADSIVASGNLIVATHGETVDETLRDPTPEEIAQLAEDAASGRVVQKVRQRLRLSTAPLAHLDTETTALFEPLQLSPVAPSGIQPVDVFLARESRSKSTLELRVEGFSEAWSEQQSLLDSGSDDQVYRLEIDDQGETTVVFGDDVFGLRPEETTKVSATYRVGGGTIGNVAAETLIEPRPRTAENISWLVTVTNPLPATGGRDLESRDHARRIAPETFQKPLVAVTEADYRAAALDFTLPGNRQPVQNAKANFRWTGSWLTLTLAVDPKAGEKFETLRRPLIDFLNTRRLAGYDLRVIGALDVAVELAIEFCLKPGFLPGDVQEAIEQALSTSELPGGKKGLFHPDNFSFGDFLYISRIFAAVMAVPGVESAQITRLAPLHAARPDRDTKRNLLQGFLAVGSDQILRLDNDRNFPERGTLLVRAKGVIE